MAQEFYAAADLFPLQHIVTTNALFHPRASATPENIGDLVFQATSNTSLTLKLRGSDGVVRSAVLALA